MQLILMDTNSSIERVPKSMNNFVNNEHSQNKKLVILQYQIFPWFFFISADQFWKKKYFVINHFHNLFFPFMVRSRYIYKTTWPSICKEFLLVVKCRVHINLSLFKSEMLREYSGPLSWIYFVDFKLN